MYEVSVEHTFSSAHYLRNYKGKCENLHGHNYRVQVIVQGETLDGAGMLVDFGDLKKDLRMVTDRLDHFNLNDIPPFTEVNPSAENIARYLYDELQRCLSERPAGANARVHEVKLWETDIQYATYRP